MDYADARELNSLTTSFYQQVEASFSATRQAPWRGWERVASLVAREWAGSSVDGAGLRVLDLACGNLRFERFLAERVGPLRAWAYDNCDALAQGSPTPPGTSFRHLDVVQTLLEETSLADALDAPACDLCVSFGFMHHLALPEHRLRVVEALVEKTRPGGHVALSFWQLSHDPRILAKAQALSDEGDYLLGWQNERDVWRYCHDFAEDEVSLLVSAVEPHARLVERFHADGKTGDLNCYVVLQVR